MPPFCAPSSLSVGDVAKRFVAYINANPDRRSDAAATSLLEVLTASLPCRQ
jgi:Rap1a immunity proteins